MRLEIVNIKNLKPYKNIRNYNKSINYLMESIEDFGFITPVLVTPKYVTVDGWQRVIAAKKCGYDRIPCLVIDELDEDKIKAYRVICNQIGESTLWNYKEKREEIKAINMNLSKYGLPEDYANEVNIDEFFEKTFYQASFFDEVENEDMFSCSIE